MAFEEYCLGMSLLEDESCVREAGNRRKTVKRDLEVTRSRCVRSKNRRRGKFWAQTVLGVILGLLLGFTVEFNVYVTRGMENDSFCKPILENASPAASKLEAIPMRTSRLGIDVVGYVNRQFCGRDRDPQMGLEPLSYFTLDVEEPDANLNLQINASPNKNRGSSKNVKLEMSNTPGYNSQDGLVFVGVMTAQKYLSTRAVAVYETWGTELPGRIAFFSSESSTPPDNRPDLPLVRLPRVDDSYPPQKKSFMMLQHMWDNYGNRFEWFIRADDDVYIRPDKLEAFLRSVDSRKPLFIGQAGRGNQEEFGLLSLEFDENFCMGGPGIIMSRETLSRIAPHVKYCLKNLYTTHEDVELGRCVRKFADISCTWSYEMQTILYHNSSGSEAFTGNLKSKEVNRAITLHPVKQHQYMYRLHNYMTQLKIQELQHEVILLKRDVRRALDKLSLTGSAKLSRDYELLDGKPGSDNYLGDVHLTGKEPSIGKYRAASEEDVLHWDFIQRSMYSEGNLNPRRRIEAPYREGIEDVIREFMEMINQLSRQRGRTIEYQDLLYGYIRVDPLHGADYILDMLLKYKKYRGKKMTVPVRRHAYLQQQFAGIEIRDVTDSVAGDEEQSNYGTGLKNAIEKSWMDLRERFRPSARALGTQRQGIAKAKIINFILPLSGRFQTFLRFMKNYEEVALANDGRTALVVVLFGKGRDSANAQIAECMDRLQRKYPDASLKLIPVNQDFARAMALDIGSAYCKDDDSNILFFIDVDVVFRSETLSRIRLSTVRGKQVYFPIIYSEFDPTLVYGNRSLSTSPDHFFISPDTGYWRQFGFGIASAYKKDLKAVGGFDTSIRGWGKEDVDLYEKFVSSPANLTIFRSVDPTLVHVFHLVDCDPNLETSQLKMCRGTRKDTYGNVNQLAQCIYNSPRSIKTAVTKKRKPI